MEAVVSKVIDRLDGHCRDFIARSPFVLVATADEAGNCDVSPKGGPAGFVAVLDERRLAIPDAPGNRLVYSLRNIVAAGRVGLLFLIPGIEETLRVNGRPRLVADAPYFDSLVVKGKRPQLAVVIEVEELYMHFAKAFLRSSLWMPETWPDRSALPSLGKQSQCAALFGCHRTMMGQRPGRNNDWRGRRGKMTRGGGPRYWPQGDCPYPIVMPRPVPSRTRFGACCHFVSVGPSSARHPASVIQNRQSVVQPPFHRGNPFSSRAICDGSI